MSNAGQPLSVQFVTTSLMQGGAEVQVFLLAAELKRRGHTVTLVSMRDAEAFESELQELEIPFHSLAMQRGIGDPRALFKLANVVRANRPDVVHSHMVHANLLTRLARLLSPMPVQISTAHNYSEGARWRELAYRVTDPLCDLTTNVCRLCVEHFVAVGATPKARIKYMPNGLDLANFQPQPGAREAKRQELGIAPGTFLWLAVGRLEEQKDYPNLIEAVRQLAARNDAAPTTILVAGEGNLHGELDRLVQAAGLDGAHFRMLGARKDVVDLMAAADAYVMSSAWEGLPMVLLEAGASRLPAVVTDVGGNREVVTDGKTGFVVSPRDPTALAEAMLRLMQLGEDEKRAMGEAAHHEIELNFGLAGVVDQWEAVYRELLARRGKA